jgi:hypothetical protein
MGVIVTDAVTSNGPAISGDRVGLVVVHVDTYEPSVGGHGTVVARAR